MKSKKTIRKMTKAPLTRAIAKLQREVRSINRKMDKLVKLADTTERDNRTLTRELRETRARLALVSRETRASLASLQGPPVGTQAGYDPDQGELWLWPLLPNGEGIADGA